MPEHMEVDAAEAKLKTMEHSEQHYFKRCVGLQPTLTSMAMDD